MKVLGGIVLIILLPLLIVLAIIEPSFIGELGIWSLLSFFGVASFAGWLLSKFK